MFRKLKGLMYAMDVDQKTLSEAIGKSQGYVTSRMMGRQPFSITDIYTICDLLEIPVEQIHEYFPRQDCLKMNAGQL